MSIGITNLIGGVLVEHLVPKIGLHSRTTQLTLTTIMSFLLSYINSTLFMMVEGNILSWNPILIPTGLSKNWFEIYGNCIFTSTFTTTFLPYFSPVFGLLFKACGRKNLKPGVFKIEKKYSVMLTTIFVAFTYGFEIPLLFISVSICFFVQYLLDKIFITYWYEMNPIRSDLLIKITTRILKFAPVPMFLVASRALQANSCMVFLNPSPIEVVN